MKHVSLEFMAELAGAVVITATRGHLDSTSLETCTAGVRIEAVHAGLLYSCFVLVNSHRAILSVFLATGSGAGGAASRVVLSFCTTLGIAKGSDVNFSVRLGAWMAVSDCLTVASSPRVRVANDGLRSSQHDNRSHSLLEAKDMLGCLLLLLLRMLQRCLRVLLQSCLQDRTH
ncbi:unnamed protein product [Prorocentrum cordatum]|uniref:Secreted protein n=1 Tax=Prorocentrum cordatum TaxID=2364126 RepID=A0ABN9QYR1_9DINO|nr:unnamed protein product [Polarella glacialis]